MATGFRRYAAFRVARRAETDLRDRMFAHLQGLHFAYHDQAQTGQLMSRANTDLNQVQQFLVMIPLTLSNAVGRARRRRRARSRSTRVLTLLAVGTLPAAQRRRPPLRHQAPPRGRSPSRPSRPSWPSVVEESVSGVRVVKGFGAEDVQRRRFAVEADDVYDASMRATMVRATYWP